MINAVDTNAASQSIGNSATWGTRVEMDDSTIYGELAWRGCSHEKVFRSADKYGNDQAHTQGIESSRAMLECSITATFHWTISQAAAALRR